MSHIIISDGIMMQSYNDAMHIFATTCFLYRPECLDKCVHSLRHMCWLGGDRLCIISTEPGAGNTLTELFINPKLSTLSVK